MGRAIIAGVPLMKSRIAITITLGAFAIGVAQPARNASSTLLSSIANEYWQHLLKDSVEQRLRLRGSQVENLPDVSFEKAQDEAKFASSLLERMRSCSCATDGG